MKKIVLVLLILCCGVAFYSCGHGAVYVDDPPINYEVQISPGYWNYPSYPYPYYHNRSRHNPPGVTCWGRYCAKRNGYPQPSHNRPPNHNRRNPHYPHRW